MRKSPLLLMFALLMATSTASAGDPAAEALFRAGRSAAETGDFTTACARFEESYRLEPATGTAFNLGYCHEKLGHTASAWQRYREVQEKLPPSDDRYKVVEEKTRALEARLPRLTIKLSDAAKGAKVVRDGAEIGLASLGLELPVDPGRHEIVVRLQGHRDRVEVIELGEGEHKQLLLEPGEREVAAQGAAVAADKPKTTGVSATSNARLHDSSQRNIGITLGALGVVGIATSAVTGVMTMSRKSTVEEQCPNKVCTSNEALEAADSGRTLSAVSTIAFAVGVASLGIGTYLILSAPNGKEAARLELRAAPNAAALQLGGKF